MSMSTKTLHLTCRCGARLDVASVYSSDLAGERKAFDQAHAVCRQAEVPTDDHAYDAGDVQPRTPDRPRRRPRIGGYLVSTPRNMPRGVLGRRLAEKEHPA